jgi:hypothetical protein
VEIQRSQYIRPKVTVHKCAETIQGRKLFKGGNYTRKYGMSNMLIGYFFDNGLLILTKDSSFLILTAYGAICEDF